MLQLAEDADLHVVDDEGGAAGIGGLGEGFGDFDGFQPMHRTRPSLWTGRTLSKAAIKDKRSLRHPSAGGYSQLRLRSNSAHG